MPIYEFKCKTCGNIDELLMKFSDPSPTNCSKCSGPIEKMISNTSFSLKGDGWYVTDYKKKPTEAGPTAEDAPTKTDDSKNNSDGTPAAADSAKSAGQPAAAETPKAVQSSPAKEIKDTKIPASN